MVDEQVPLDNLHEARKQDSSVLLLIHMPYPRSGKGAVETEADLGRLRLSQRADLPANERASG